MKWSTQEASNNLSSSTNSSHDLLKPLIRETQGPEGAAAGDPSLPLRERIYGSGAGGSVNVYTTCGDGESSAHSDSCEGPDGHESPFTGDFADGGIALSGNRGRPSLCRRLFAPIQPGGLRASIFTLSASCLGAGVLTTPYAMSQCGILIGCGLLLLHALVSCATSAILLASARRYRCCHYSKLAAMFLAPSPRRNLDSAQMMGSPVDASSVNLMQTDSGNGLRLKRRRARLVRVVDWLIVLNGAGCTVGLLVFLGDFLPATLEPLSFVPHFLKRRNLLLALSVLLTWPLCVKKELSALRHFALFPVFALATTLACVLVRTPQMMALNADLPLSIATFNINFFKAFNIFLFAFMQHVTVCLVGGELHNATPRRELKVTSRAACLEFMLYMPMSVAGYLSFRSNTQQNFVMNYSLDDGLFMFVRVLLCCSITLAVPLGMIPTVQSLENLVMERKSAGSCCTVVDHEACEDASPMLGERSTASVISVQQLDLPGHRARPARALHNRPEANAEGEGALSGDEGVPSTPAPSSADGYLRRVCLRLGRSRKALATILLTPAFVTALLTDRAADVVGLLGGFLATTFVCVVPAFVYLRGIGQSHGRITRFGVFGFLMAICAIGFVASGVIALEALGLFSSH